MYRLQSDINNTTIEYYIKTNLLLSPCLSFPYIAQQLNTYYIILCNIKMSLQCFSLRHTCNIDKTHSRKITFYDF